ncbi:epoxide hydrolase family protein [Nocardioides sp.]|jgi:pimeloyl-ACP methyl ester carboxylesterase|uniref:epoxide hydrolase family protein n=1 Tax=Nocardioides sp. TaxID=35761 RepID=UPI0031FE509E|nr:putative hydrolase [Nocardioides sp.]
MTSEIRPFRLEIDQARLDDVKERLVRTRFPDQPDGAGWDYGVPAGYLRERVDYWRDQYDWRAQEALLNGLPQFVTAIDGQHVHFAHVRSPEPDAVPLLMTHGWPSSPAEFLEVAAPLTNPRAHGGDPADAFHLVLPSLPGTGLSGPARDTGWNIRRIASVLAELMRRLDYERYGAQGGDWGAKISRELGLICPDKVIGVHANGTLGTPVGEIDPRNLTEAERERLAAADLFRRERLGYAMIQRTRPQTVAAALLDSPAGLLAWHADLFEWFDPEQELGPDRLPADYILTSVMLYWLTATAASAARLYHDAEDNAWAAARQRSSVPTGVAIFPTDTGIRAFAEQENNIVRWSEYSRGGHFAARQAPDLLVGDVREFFRPLR